MLSIFGGAGRFDLALAGNVASRARTEGFHVGHEQIGSEKLPKTNLAAIAPVARRDKPQYRSAQAPAGLPSRQPSPHSTLRTTEECGPRPFVWRCGSRPAQTAR